MLKYFTPINFILIFILFYILLGSIVGSSNNVDNCLSQMEIISTESDSFAYRCIINVNCFGTVHAVWKDRSNYQKAGGDWDIFYKYKLKGGNWSNTEVLTKNSNNNCRCFAFDVDKNGNLYVVWSEERITEEKIALTGIFFIEKLVNNNWSKVQLISTETTGFANCPYMAVDDFGIIHVAWGDNSNYSNSGNDYDILYKYRDINGSWSITEVVTTYSRDNSSRPFFDIDSKRTIHLVWEEKTTLGDSGEDWDVFYTFKKLDETWQSFELISTESSKDSNRPILRVDTSDNIHVIWIDKTNISSCDGDYDIFYKKKSNDSIWSKLEIVTNESNDECNWISMVLDTKGIIHVAWADKTNYLQSGKDADILYKQKFKNHWSPAMVISTESNYDSAWSWIAVGDKDIVHFTWWDDMGNWVIFYKNLSCIAYQEDISSFDFNNTTIDETPFVSSLFFIILITIYAFILKIHKFH